MARTRGSLNTKPSKAAIRNYYKTLRNAADNGDPQAAAALIKLHQEQRSHAQ